MHQKQDWSESSFAGLDHFIPLIEHDMKLSLASKIATQISE